MKNHKLNAPVKNYKRNANLEIAKTHCKKWLVLLEIVLTRLKIVTTDLKIMKSKVFMSTRLKENKKVYFALIS